MFDTNARARERFLGLSAIGAIGIGAALAVDLMVTGGFDFAPRNAAHSADRESAHVTVVDATRYASDQFDRIWAETLASEAHAATLEDLDGADDGSPALVEGESPPTGDELYAEIRALYEQSEPAEVPVVEEPNYEDAPVGDAPPADDKRASAYENG